MPKQDKDHLNVRTHLHAGQGISNSIFDKTIRTQQLSGHKTPSQRVSENENLTVEDGFEGQNTSLYGTSPNNPGLTSNLIMS